MNQVIYAFLLTTIAGLSTMIGSIFVFFIKNKTDRFITAALAFASSVMLTVSLTDLIPESINILFKNYKFFPAVIILLISINIGIIISNTIDKYLPKKSNNNLYRVGIISMIAIIVHNIPEGMATFIASSTDFKLGITLTIAIALHNIPEGISISIPIFYSTNSKKKALKYTFISGISELFGAIITYLILKPLINDNVMGLLFGIIAGIMLYISIFELLPTSIKYKNIKITNLFYLLGTFFIIITHFIFN